MSTPVSTLELRIIERVLDMGQGYVLDFTDRTFSAFFAEYDIDIDNRRFHSDGSSKAKRLRCFLRTSKPPLTGRVLAGLLQHRVAWKPEIPREDLDAYQRIVSQTGGELPNELGTTTGNSTENQEATLLAHIFHPEAFNRLPLDPALSAALVDRMQESQRCIAASAYLAAVILCGSVIEGLCLGFGSRHPERVNRAYLARYKKPAGQLHAWKLREWIEVLGQLGDLSPNIEKFGHALRDVRNYVHPSEQIAHGFSPDQHTARIGFHVVVGAVDDLVRAEASIAASSSQ